MKDYADFYQRLTQPIRKRPASIRCLRLSNSLVTKIMYLIYPILLIYLWWQAPKRLMAFILIPAIAFVLVSVIRKRLNVPRPYEAWAITPLIAKNTKGQSFPSRHVFSATIISMAVLRLNIILGSICLLLSLLLTFCRLLGGVHYPRDVTAGFLIGLACGTLLFLF